MIRGAIAGGCTPVAGEIAKILINHPDVELAWVYDPEAENVLASNVHKGLRGESYLRFTAHPQMDTIDVLFLCFDEPEEGRNFLRRFPADEKLRIVDVTGDFRQESLSGDSDWVYGISELNRKAMVRGARKVAVPDALASAVLLGLLPLAKVGQLDSTIHISAMVHDEDAEPGEPLALLDHEDADEIRGALRALQPTFDEDMLFTAVTAGWRRGVSAVIYFETPLSETEVIKLYDQYYDDHSFTFLSESLPSISDVIGTNKCVINLQKVGKNLVISVAIDDMMRGGAATAVHDMNLLFGLQERVGLMLITQS